MMAWAIFNTESNWSRPKSIFSFNAHASPDPQERPRDFIEYCISKGWATEATPPKREDAKRLKEGK